MERQRRSGEGSEGYGNIPGGWRTPGSNGLSWVLEIEDNERIMDRKDSVASNGYIKISDGA